MSNPTNQPDSQAGDELRQIFKRHKPTGEGLGHFDDIIADVRDFIQADRERLYGELETRLTKASYSSSREGRIVNLIVGLQVLNKVFNREGAES